MPSNALIRFLDGLSLALCILAAPAMIAGDWLRELADALRYRQAVLERIRIDD